MTISRDLVRAFGGDIDIISEEKKGTDFVINLRSKSRITQEEHTKFFKRTFMFETLHVETKSSDQLEEQLIMPDMSNESSDSSSNSFIQSS